MIPIHWCAILVTVALALAGCGGNAPSPGTTAAQDVVAAAEASLRDVHSAVMDLRFTVAGLQENDAAAGFAMAGPFALPESGQLPTMDLAYTQIAGPEEVEIRIVSTGEAAVAEVDGQVVELPSEQLEGLRGGDEGAQGLETLGLNEWFRQPQVVTEGSERRVEGELDLLAALRGLARFTQMVGAENPAGGAFDGGTDEVRAAVKESHVELVMNGESLTRLAFDAVLRTDGEVPEALAGGRFTFSLQLSDHNEPVTVELPDAQP